MLQLLDSRSECENDILSLVFRLAWRENRIEAFLVVLRRNGLVQRDGSMLSEKRGKLDGWNNVSHLYTMVTTKATTLWINVSRRGHTGRLNSIVLGSFGSRLLLCSLLRRFALRRLLLYVLRRSRRLLGSTRMLRGRVPSLPDDERQTSDRRGCRADERGGAAECPLRAPGGARR